MIRVFLVLMLVACGPGAKGGPSMRNTMNGPEPTPQGSPVGAGEIPPREPIANAAKVKHILIGWNDGGESHDQRAAARPHAQAEKPVQDTLQQLPGGAGF